MEPLYYKLEYHTGIDGRIARAYIPRGQFIDARHHIIMPVARIFSVLTEEEYGIFSRPD